MGNSCCSYTISKASDYTMPRSSDTDLASFTAQQIKYIIRLQAWARGNKVRKTITYNSSGGFGKMSKLRAL